MPGARDLADRRHDLLVIDDPSAVLARIGGLRRRRKLDRNAHPLPPLALCAAPPAAAHQHEVVHEPPVTVGFGRRYLGHPLHLHSIGTDIGCVLSSRKRQIGTTAICSNRRGACGRNSGPSSCAAMSSTSRSGSFSAPPSRQSSTRWSTTLSCRRSGY